LSLGKEWNIRALRLMSTLNRNSVLAPSGFCQDVGSRQKTQKCSTLSPSYIRPIQSGSSFTLYSNLGSNSITRKFSTTNKKEGSGNGDGSGSGQSKFFQSLSEFSPKYKNNTYCFCMSSVLLGLYYGARRNNGKGPSKGEIFVIGCMGCVLLLLGCL